MLHPDQTYNNIDKYLLLSNFERDGFEFCQPKLPQIRMKMHSLTHTAISSMKTISSSLPFFFIILAILYIYISYGLRVHIPRLAHS